MTDEEQKAWEELVAEAKRPASMRPYVGHVRVPTETFLAVDAELKALRARVAVLEKVAELAATFIHGCEYEPAMDDFWSAHSALDAVKEG